MRQDLYIPRTTVFFGCKGSGKSTMGEAIQKVLPGVALLGFADPLKQIVKDVFGFSDEDLYGSSEKRETLYRDFELSGDCLSCGAQCLRPADDATEQAWWSCPRCHSTYPKYVTPRVALQSLGTEWGRRVHRNIWAVTGIRAAQRHDAAAITDGRFWNELRATRLSAYKTRTVSVGLLRGSDVEPTNHPSERQPWEIVTQRACDIMVDNRTGTVDEAVDQLFHQLHTWCRRSIPSGGYLVVGEP